MRCRPHRRAQEKRRRRRSLQLFLRSAQCRPELRHQKTSCVVFLLQCLLDRGDLFLTRLDRFYRQVITLLRPGSEIEQLAPFRAERAKLIAFVLDFLAATWTLDDRHKTLEMQGYHTMSRVSEYEKILYLRAASVNYTKGCSEPASKRTNGLNGSYPVGELRNNERLQGTF